MTNTGYTRNHMRLKGKLKMNKAIAAILTLLVILLIVYLPYRTGLIVGGRDTPAYTWAYGLLTIIAGIFVVAAVLTILFLVALLINVIYVTILDLIGG